MNQKVSIVIPVYNMGKKLVKCVETLINQTYHNLEIILVDDGSKDNSLQICQELERKDSRIRVFHQENQGAGPARNHGIDHATGKYIYFPDADDYLERNAIELLVQNIVSTESDLVVFGYKKVNQDGQVCGTKKYEPAVLDGDYIRKSYADFITMEAKNSIQGAPWNKLFAMEVINKYNIRYPALRRHQDEGFIGRYMTYAKNVSFMGQVLYTYYVNDLKTEWDKYPVDYIEAVIGLYKERQQNILVWNKQDKVTHDIVYREYICNVIKTLELSFSPKHHFKRKNMRMKWIEDAIDKSEIKSVPIPEALGKYQERVLDLICREKYNKLYYLLFLKVQIQKNGFLEKLKKIIRNR